MIKRDNFSECIDENNNNYDNNNNKNLRCCRFTQLRQIFPHLLLTTLELKFALQSAVLSYSSAGLCVKVCACGSKRISSALNSSWNYTCPANVTRSLLLYSAFFCDRIVCDKLPSGYFPGVWVLKADVSEHCIGSIFNRRWSVSEDWLVFSPYLYGKRISWTVVWANQKWGLKTSQSSLTIHHLLKMEPIQCSETSAFNTQTPGKYPEDNLSLLQHSESLKTRIVCVWNFILEFLLPVFKYTSIRWNILPIRMEFNPLTLRLLMSYIYGAPILDVSRSHTTTQHSR